MRVSSVIWRDELDPATICRLQHAFNPCHLDVPKIMQLAFWSRFRPIQALALVLLAASSCSDDDEEQGHPADCDYIASICHSYDEESDFARECHETGHDARSPVTCTRMRAACKRQCPDRAPAAAGAGGGAGGSELPDSQSGAGGAAGHGGASQLATACETLGHACHGVGSGLTETCHELGHAGDEPACEAEFEACLQACTQAGHGGGSG